MGKGYFVLAIIAFAAFLVQASPWNWFASEYRAPVVENWLESAHHLGLERPFWSSLLVGLVLACVLEGICRARRSAA